jgi:hypothetical protein
MTMSPGPRGDLTRRPANAGPTYRVRMTSTAGLRAAERWSARLGDRDEGGRVAPLVGVLALYGPEAVAVAGSRPGMLAVALPTSLARAWAAAAGAERNRLLATLLLVAGAVTCCYERRDDILVGVITASDGLLPVRVVAPRETEGWPLVAAWLTATLAGLDATLADADRVPAGARDLVAEGIAVALDADLGSATLSTPLCRRHGVVSAACGATTWRLSPRPALTRPSSASVIAPTSWTRSPLTGCLADLGAAVFADASTVAR